METPLNAAQKPAGLRLSWPAIWFMAVLHLGGIAGIYYLATGNFSLATLYLAVSMFLLSGLGITAGYHRCFSHRAYAAHPAIKVIYLVLAAASFTGSALKWSADHRRHHAYTDKERDPYNAKVGFWWSHIGWIFFKSPAEETLTGANDLRNDRWILWQHRWFYVIASVVAIIIPCALASLWGDFLGGLLVAFFLRTLTLHHTVYCVNSIAHTIGWKTWSETVSARDNYIAAYVAMAGLGACIYLLIVGFTHAGVLGILGIIAIIGIGELFGHSFHHRFKRDYRNGPHWWDLDPTRWIILGLAVVGLASDLHKTSDPEIETISKKKNT